MPTATSTRRPLTRSLRRHAAGVLGALMLTGLVASPAAHAQPSHPHDDAEPVALEISEVELDGGPRISEVVVTVENPSERHARKMEVDVQGPVGWTVSPTQEHRQLKRGEEVDLTFQIHVPQLREQFAEYHFTATARYDGGDGAGTVSETRTETVGEPLENLEAAFNRVGVTAEENAGAGDFDGGGNTFSLERLEEAGVVPGADVEVGGATFTFPEVGEGLADHVAGGGATIEYSGQGERLVFLGSGASFNAVSSVTVRYTDGTTSTGTIGFPNWSFQEEDAHGATLAVSTPGRHTPDGYANEEFDYRMFTHSIELDPSKEIEMVSLPNSGDTRVFAMAIAD